MLPDAACASTGATPRPSADGEQALYEQLRAVLETGQTGNVIELNIQSAQWFQNLMLPVEELAVFTAPLVEQARRELLDFAEELSHCGPPHGNSPDDCGREIARTCRQFQPPASRTCASGEPGDSDFGEGLLDEVVPAAASVLDEDAIDRSAYDLASRVHRGEQASEWHEEVTIPAGAVDSIQSGPARLHFSGQDHFLKKANFSLAHDPNCDLTFASELYPSVSARHCEIHREPRGYLLRDRDRHGTLVNDQAVQGQTLLKPGDWIRLGPGGPQLHSSDNPPTLFSS